MPLVLVLLAPNDDEGIAPALLPRCSEEGTMGGRDSADAAEKDRRRLGCWFMVF